MPVSPPDFEYVRELVRESAAIVLDPGKEYLVETRLEPLARSEGFESLGGMVDALRTGRSAGLRRKVVDRMTTNETSFFRDFHPFEALRRYILPELIARRQAERTLQFWCGACSSGQEPYSLLMLLREHFPLVADWNVHTLATDINATMLERARRAVFSQLEVNRGLPAPMLVKYFEKCDHEWHLAPKIQRGVEFRELNLNAPSWPNILPADVIFLRNALIYFDAATKRSIFAQLRRVLRPDGYLILGAAETTYGLDESYERVVFDKATAYRLKA
jgi:chemotaxis protein methyltransferase CheR